MWPTRVKAPARRRYGASPVHEQRDARRERNLLIGRGAILSAVRTFPAAAKLRTTAELTVGNRLHPRESAVCDRIQTGSTKLRTRMATFRVFRDRDACATIRGYFYQIQITIQHWLDLDRGEGLILECGEDIDRVGRVLSNSSPGSEGERVLGQVKYRGKPVTLRSAEALAALTAFHCHRVANPQIRLTFRYITNASVGRETKSQMPGGLPAIEAWERLRLGSLASSQQVGVLAGIRLLLRTVPKPASVREDDWQDLRQFILTANDAALLGLVCSVEWATGVASFEMMEDKIKRHLMETGRSASIEESSNLYSRLVLFVFKRLSGHGPKALSPEDLDVIISEPRLSSADRGLLEIIEQLHGLVTETSQEIRKIREDTADTRRIVRAMASSVGVGDVKAVAIQPLPIDVPPPVQHLSSRDASVGHLVEALKASPYCAIHGEVGSGKTQLAVLTYRRLGGRAIWVRARTMTCEQAGQALDAAISAVSSVRPGPIFANWCSKACRALGRKTLIVIDDIPRVIPDDHLGMRLSILADIAAVSGLRIVSTSAYELPIAVQEQLGALVVPAKAPPFSDDEIEELFLAYGMPSRLGIRTFIPMLEAVTRRHPVLLAAAARHMASEDWSLNWSVVEDLLRGVFAQHVKPDTMHVLLATVPDASTRNLLYRLTLAGPFFTKDCAAVVAAVRPSLDRPIERFNEVLGLWVQQENASTYSLSPLLGNLDLDLSVTTQHETHLALADEIMRKRVLGPVEVLSAVAHLVGAGAVKRAAVLLLMALMDFNELEEVAESWGLLGVWADTKIPTEVDLTLRLLLRAHQCVAFLRRGRDAVYLLNDFDDLLSQAGEAEALAITIGCALLAVRLRDERPSRANRYLAKSLACGDKLTLPGGASVAILGEAALEHMLWGTASAAKNEVDVKSWLSVLEGLKADQLSRVLNSEFADYGSVIFCDGVWRREVAKPFDQRQWSPVLDQLKAIEQTSSRLGAETLKACSLRARICVLGECVKDVDGALDLATQSLESLGNDSVKRFLLTEVAGRVCVYAERWSDAARWLNQSSVLRGDAYPILRVDALVALSEAVSHTVSAAAAVPPCEQAVRTARSTPDIPEITLVQALGENAIASWYAGDKVSAYKHVQECVERLLSLRSDKTTWKKTFILAGHVCGYLATMASHGKLPDGMTDYAPPKRGLFNASSPDLANFYDPNREWVIAGQLALFATALDDDEGAASWALRAVEMGRTAQGGEISGILKLYAITQATLDERYLDALELALEATTAVVSSITRAKDGQPPSSVSPPTSLSELSMSDLEAQSVERALFLGLLPVAFGLAAAWLNDAASATDAAVSVAAKCRELAQGTKSPEMWNRAAEVMVAIFRAEVSMDELKDLGENLASISSSLHSICYLGAMLRARPEHAVRIQLAIIPHLETLLSDLGAYRRVVVPFVRRYWEKRLEESPFYFRSPAHTLERVRGTDTLPFRPSIRKLLGEVSRSLGLRLGPAELTWLADRSSTSPST
jgi:hypothetical protein